MKHRFTVASKAVETEVDPHRYICPMFHDWCMWTPLKFMDIRHYDSVHDLFDLVTLSCDGE